MLRRLCFILACLLFIPSFPAMAQVFDGSDRFREHLSFLGYAVEEQADNDQLVARHDSHANVVMRSFGGGVLLQSFYTMKRDREGLRATALELINRFNEKAKLTRFYIDKDGDLAIEALFLIEYDREDFGLFMETYNDDIASQLSSMSDVEREMFD